MLLSDSDRPAGLREVLLHLRIRLEGYPMREDCVGFAGLPLSPRPMSFFPGGLGVYDHSRDRVSVLVLGSDWGTKASFDRQFSEPTRREPTIAGTDRMLLNIGIDPGDCFYTNAWPVMRLEAPEQGHHPMRDDAAFTGAYRDYFRLCLRMLRPRLIITLGIAPAWFMGSLAGPSWRCGRATSSRKLNARDIDVEPGYVGNIVLVAATHPSHANNSRLRAFASDEDEAALLRRAAVMAGVVA